MQKRWASEEITQSEPEADGAAEAQHGDNSIAAASETKAPASADQHEESTVSESIKSATYTAAAQASAAAEAVGSAAGNASNYVRSVGGSSSAAQPAIEESNTVYVGNLFFDVTAEDLRKEFAKAGGVENVKIIYDQRGLSKG